MPRADRRRQDRKRATTPARPAAAREAAAPAAAAIRPLDAAWLVLAVLAWVVTAMSMFHRITWYLAVDQFGYLTFAHDLLHGRVFHEWPVATALASRLPDRTDVLAQTYIWDKGRMYCRYAPGFPLILAGWLAVFGDDAAHVLNPWAYVVFLGVYTLLLWRIFRSRWRALVGTSFMLLFPTYTFLWALTLTRDLIAHLLGFTALLLLMPWRGQRLEPGRLAVVGLLLGTLASVRPDGVLYLLPAGAVLLLRWRREQPQRVPMFFATGASLVVPAVVVPALLFALAGFFDAKGLLRPIPWVLGAAPLAPLALFARARSRAWSAERVAALRFLDLMTLTFVLALTPSLAYNWTVTGNPFWPPQAVEVQEFFAEPRSWWPKPKPTVEEHDAPKPAETPADRDGKTGYASPSWQGGYLDNIQGGALRLANLPRTLTGNLNLIERGYGTPFIAIALWGIVLAVVQRPLVAVATLAYAVPALLLYSCWERPDGRYVLGVHFFMPLLLVEGLFGTLDAARRLARLHRLTLASTLAGVAALVFAGMAVFTEVPEMYGRTTLPLMTNQLVLPVMALAAAAAVVWPSRRIGAWAAVALGVALAVAQISRARDVLAQPNASFQRPQMERARATLQQWMPPNSVILSFEEIGRPAENIEYYSGVSHAFYQTDLARWKIHPHELARLLIQAGIQPYVLMQTPQTKEERDALQLTQVVWKLDKVVDIPKEKAIEWFVAASFHRGLPLTLYKISPTPVDSPEHLPFTVRHNR